MSRNPQTVKKRLRRALLLKTTLGLIHFGILLLLFLLGVNTSLCDFHIFIRVISFKNVVSEAANGSDFEWGFTLLPISLTLNNLLGKQHIKLTVLINYFLTKLPLSSKLADIFWILRQFLLPTNKEAQNYSEKSILVLRFILPNCSMIIYARRKVFKLFLNLSVLISMGQLKILKRLSSFPPSYIFWWRR